MRRTPVHLRAGRRPGREEDSPLQVRYLTPNGARRIGLVEQENRIQVERVPSRFAGFLNIMNMQTTRAATLVRN